LNDVRVVHDVERLRPDVKPVIDFRRRKRPTLVQEVKDVIVDVSVGQRRRRRRQRQKVVQRLCDAPETGQESGAPVGRVFRIERRAENVLRRDEKRKDGVDRYPVAEVDGAEGETELE